MKSAAIRVSILAAGILVGVLLAAATGSGAETTGPTAKAKAAAKEHMRGRRGPRGFRGRRGFRGPRGFTGPMGRNGSAGERGPSGATKVLYRAGADSGALQPFFTGDGFALEAACNPFQARVRSTANDAHVVLSGMDGLRVPFFVSDADFDSGEATSLYQTTGPAKTEVQGTLVVATPSGATATVVYAIDFDAAVGACAVAGTLSPAP
jgi:Collagen triple helix repeat (20 copies)